MPTLHVVMPVYDEGPTLETIVDRVLCAPLPTGWSVRLVMVDDGSRPAAARVAEECAAAFAFAGVNRYDSDCFCIEIK